MLPPSVAPLSPLRYARRLGWLAAAIAILLISNAINTNLKDYVQDVIQQCGFAIILAVSLNIVNGMTGQFSIGHAGFMAVGAYTGATRHLSGCACTTRTTATPGVGWMLVAMLVGGLCSASGGLYRGRSQPAAKGRLSGDCHAWDLARSSASCWKTSRTSARTWRIPVARPGSRTYPPCRTS